MDNNILESEVKLQISRAKRANCIIFGITIALFVILVSGYFIHRYQSIFTTEKWIEHPLERTKIVDNFLLKYEMSGMTPEEVVALLGSDNSDYGYFVENNRFVYRLGYERGFISIDSEWLIIDFENGHVKDYHITTD